MEYQSGDVRDTEVLHEAFRDADVVVHLAFLIVGGKRATTRAINVDGTLNAFRAAAAAEARRFVYASSVVAYGFHRDNPVGMTEEWPTRPADTLFYSQEKAELEQLLRAESTFHPDLDLYLLRPSIVLGPHAAGAKELLPEPLASLARGLREQIRRLPLPVPTPVPDLPVQFVHSDDVGRALRQCVSAPVRPVRTTSPVTACSARSTSHGSWASSRCPCPPGRCAPRRGRLRGCRSCPAPRSGWRR